MKPAKFLIIVITEVILVVCLSVLLLNNSSKKEVANPGLDSWESRYTLFEDGIWYVDESVYPSETPGEEEIDLIYGPYLSLPAGCYNVSIDYSIDEDQTFEVYSAQYGDKIIKHEEELLSSDSDHASYHFTLLKNVDDLEVRIHYNGLGAMSIENISISTSTFAARQTIIWIIIIAFLLDVCLYIICSKEYRIAATTDNPHKNWIDICRGLGILLVLVSHQYPSFNWLICGFHMPIFFILSGYLYNETSDTKLYFTKNFKRYIIPYFELCTVNLIITLIRVAIEDTISAEWMFLWIRAIFYCDEFLPTCGPLWFLPALFLTMGGLHLIHKSNKPVVRFAAITICIVITIRMRATGCPLLPWRAGQAMVGLVFAEAGHVLKKYSIIDKITRLRFADKTGLLIVLLICGINAIYENYKAAGVEIGVALGIIDNFPLFVLGGTFVPIVLMSITAMSEGKLSGRFMEPLVAIGRHSITFFAFDNCMELVALDILHFVLGYKTWYLVFAVNLVLLVILCIVWSKVKKIDLVKRLL